MQTEDRREKERFEEEETWSGMELRKRRDGVGGEIERRGGNKRKREGEIEAKRVNEFQHAGR